MTNKLHKNRQREILLFLLLNNILQFTIFIKEVLQFYIELKVCRETKNEIKHMEFNNNSKHKVNTGADQMHNSIDKYFSALKKKLRKPLIYL